MLRRSLPAERAAELRDAIAADAAARDADGGFPAGAFAALRNAGLTSAPPLEPEEIGTLLRLLADIGRGDLNVGRIFEGHVNTLLLVRAYGTAAQVARFDALAEAGEVFGVWNTDLPADPLRVEEGRLQGSKNFASGVDGLGHAIVTVTQDGARRMLAVPLKDLPVDRSWWKPLGMRASGSHLVDFSDLPIRPDWWLGGSDDYVRQPWFSAGAMRFAAVQTGGMHAVLDTMVRHLRDTGRADAPYQLHRIARCGIAVETGYAWLDRAAEAWRNAHDGTPLSAARAIAVANAARSCVEAEALAVLQEAEQAVGVAGLMAPHPLERQLRDLRTYLRQPNPDGALAALGTAIADGGWSPGLNGAASRS